MPNNFYPFFILSLLGAFLLFSTWSAFQASTPGTEVTDRDYYSKGLKYNNTLVEKRAASVLGWKVATTLAEKQLQISLMDGNSAPVSGARGLLTFYTQAESNQLALPLVENSPGSYHIQLPATLTGEITVRVDFEREGARISRQLLLNI